ncbi:gastrula zinc finger protein XlCGF57.1-like [Corythoichthys intestinalis]|uniref:gastrula zinc finger protein XlCGF57.1-like n=1 Tax=Corythoichthys intestinalis TaxID=161448 RepID=UPI0025A52CFE|nr:gastrula zinc finger protein XlCGF57.1-like [Corythoichthys intestinalis]
MCKVIMLRELVQQRLNVAIQEIFQLFEQTLVEYKEELCRTKVENVRQRELLEAVLQPQVRLHAIDIQQVSLDTQNHEGGPSEHLHIKEETWSGRYEESNCDAFTQVAGVCVKSEAAEACPQHNEEADEEKPNTDEVVSRSFNGEPAQEPSIKTSEEFVPPQPKMTTPDDPETPNIKEEHDDDCMLVKVAAAGPSCVGGLSNDVTSQSSDEPPRKAQKLFPCSECGKVLANRGILNRHMKLHTGEKPFSCPACVKTFSRRYRLVAHIRCCHPQGKPFHCSLCTQTFHQRQELRSHMKCHIGKKHYSCPTCSSTFSSKSNLQTHVRSHTGERPFVCTVCPKRFTQKAHLVLHMRVHTGEKPFSCVVCDRTFVTKSHLNYHVCAQTGDKPFPRSECNPRFTRKENTPTHMEEHAAEAPFTCAACPAAFHKRKELMAHNRTHAREKKFPCPLCARMFTKTTHVTVHMRVHTGEKPFICQFCNKSFIQKCDMMRHRMTHTGERPFGCDVCHKKFTRKVRLTKHKCPGGNDIDNIKQE